ncbi:hypothetical protein DI487_07195 [Flavobacterium sediminis]|uniref:Glycosyltransferase 2-like domain-containing protein n=2 Tax=Flavobacterium TaxID=237 RepID=A0A2U8QUA4_9FLAO|nr:hypothetical protein [Flavobacterium sediminis]AWM13669.1 hypothetical protein DI487_07195 [Flavobacterium sediminis]
MKNSTKLNIIFRTCDKVNAVHGSPRPFDLDKKELIKICFLSLVDSLKAIEHSIFIVADDLSEEMIRFFEAFKVEMIHGKYGNDNSLRECFRLAASLPDDEFVYFCEDDYLHTSDCFSEIVTLIEEYRTIYPGDIKVKQLLRKRELLLFRMKRYFKKPEFLVFPCDYPDRYAPFYMEKSFIFKTKTLHWRQIRDITFTFLVKTNTFKKHRKVFERSANRANDRFLSRKLLGNKFFYSKLLGLSPLPSLSCHMHRETMSYVVDWEKVVKDYREKLKK